MWQLVKYKGIFLFIMFLKLLQMTKKAKACSTISIHSTKAPLIYSNYKALTFSIQVLLNIFRHPKVNVKNIHLYVLVTSIRIHFYLQTVLTWSTQVHVFTVNFMLNTILMKSSPPVTITTLKYKIAALTAADLRQYIWCTEVAKIKYKQSPSTHR